MLASRVADVRRFNRMITQRVGALQEDYLGRSRPLGASRLLWEIGDTEQEVRALRSRLDLDSGYVSRLLRSLESEDLVEVGAMESDRRVRVARLTPAGLDETRLLDRRSDALAEAMLAHLGEGQQSRLLAAMAEVERLLTAAMVDVECIDPARPEARRCVRAYFDELNERFATGFDPSSSLPADDDELRPPSGGFLIARLHGEPVACGAVKLHGDGVAEIKRMWVSSRSRGLGLGKRMLHELEVFARDHGSRVARLETNRSLVEAIAMYRSLGYDEVAAFNDETYADHWFEKSLDAS